MPVLYITSDRPGAGKTALAAALAERLTRQGRAVGYFKPFSSNPEEDADVAFIARSVLQGSGDGEIPAPLPEPEGSEEGASIPEATIGEIRTLIEGLAANNELVLVEGPSLSSAEGGDGAHRSAILGEQLEAKVVVVVGYGPNLDVDSLLEACAPFGERLAGVLVNCVTRYGERELRLNFVPTIDSSGVKFLGAVPEDRLIRSVTLGQIAGHLDGRWVLGGEEADELVENFLIGGNIMDKGATYFGRMDNKAVIVRGDRPDIQLAALSTPTTCLILTGGHEPIQYVYHQAQSQEVPVLVVHTDTISTAHALDEALAGSTIHHPRKLARFQELIEAHVDMEALQEVWESHLDQSA